MDLLLILQEMLQVLYLYKSSLWLHESQLNCSTLLQKQVRYVWGKQYIYIRFRFSFVKSVNIYFRVKFLKKFNCISNNISELLLYIQNLLTKYFKHFFLNLLICVVNSSWLFCSQNTGSKRLYKNIASCMHVLKIKKKDNKLLKLTCNSDDDSNSIIDFKESNDINPVWRHNTSTNKFCNNLHNSKLVYLKY